MSGETDAIARVEQDGRVLSGGTDVARLEETMDRHADDKAAAPGKNAPPDKTEQPPLGTGTPTPEAGASATPAAPLSRGRQRFSDLTRERDEAKAAADAAKADRERIEREYQEFKARAAQPPTESAKPVEPATPAEPAKPKSFPTYEQWLETSGGETDWYLYDAQKTQFYIAQAREADTQTVEERVREAIEAREAEREFMATAKASQDRGRKAYPDFDTLLKSPTGKIAMGRTPDEAMERAHFILAHPASEHIQYAILKDEALARKLQASNAYEFGVLVAGLVPVPAAPKPAWTPPPPPAPSVGASSPTTTASSAEIAQKGGGFDAYRAKRAAERGVKSRY